MKSVIQGFLPGIALKIFLILLPTILMTMSKIEGYVSLSSLERRSASKYHLFVLVNVFLGSIITGTAFQQLKSFLDEAATEYVTLAENIFIDSSCMSALLLPDVIHSFLNNFYSILFLFLMNER